MQHPFDDLGTDAVLLAGCFIALIIYSGLRKRQRIKDAYNPRMNNVFGSARWATNSIIKAAGLYRRGGLHFGFSPDGKTPLYSSHKGHIAIVAGARAGKLLTILVSMICALDRRSSLFMLDPKLEMICIVGRIRRRMGKVYVWNPYGLWRNYMKGCLQACWNPMGDIDAKSMNFVSDCFALVDTFFDDAASHKDPHWLPNASRLFAAIIGVLVQFGKPEEKNLSAARDVLTGNHGGSVHEFAREAMSLPDHPFKQILSRYAADDAETNKEISGIISTAITQTDFLSDPTIAKAMMRSDFSYRWLKTKRGITIVVGLPPHRGGDGKLQALHAGWMLHCSIDAAQSGGRVPSIAILDEMASIGFKKAWLDAFALGAGAAHMRVVAVWQSLAQISHQFGESWNTVLQNCSVSLWFHCADHATQQAVSDLAGMTEVVSKSRSVNIDHQTGEPHISDSMSQTSRPFLYADEVGKLGPDEMICFCENVPAVIKAKRKPYTELFRGTGRNPYYTKPGFLKTILGRR